MAFHVMFFLSLQMHQYGLMVFLVHEENYISKPWVTRKSFKVKRKASQKKKLWINWRTHRGEDCNCVYLITNEGKTMKWLPTKNQLFEAKSKWMWKVIKTNTKCKKKKSSLPFPWFLNYKVV
jgi:hypothetical protein